MPFLKHGMNFTLSNDFLIFLKLFIHLIYFFFTLQ